ncbi:MAG: DeoR/GlpR transcriptional regulator [Clostridia bacterium]|nr:DeoR/GlpR transcriptional regulator [Clostridia bacterium]
MSYSDREQIILDYLKENSSVSVKRLTKLLFASEATVRRDLQKLEMKGHIIRAHGKAVRANSYADKKVDFDVREGEANPIKKRIAEAAVKDCVPEGSVVILDASSTAMHAVEFLSHKGDVIVITSGLKTAMLLSKTNIRFYSTGGKAVNGSYSFVGQTAIDTIKTFNADVCFVSCHGLSEDGFATDTSERENDMRSSMMKQSKRKVLLIDSSKIGKNCWHNLCNISEFDDVYCNTPLPEKIAKSVKNFHLV